MLNKSIYITLLISIKYNIFMLFTNVNRHVGTNILGVKIYCAVYVANYDFVNI